VVKLAIVFFALSNDLKENSPVPDPGALGHSGTGNNTGQYPATNGHSAKSTKVLQSMITLLIGYVFVRYSI